MNASFTVPTERLILQSPDRIRIDDLCRYYLRNRDFHRPYMPFRPDRWFGENAQRDRLANHGTSARHFFVVSESEPGVFGEIAFTQISGAAFQSCFAGYSIDRDQASSGWMTEALIGASAWMFREGVVSRIQANVMPHNRASIRVLQKAGFKKEGEHLDYLRINGRWEDHHSYALLQRISP